MQDFASLLFNTAFLLEFAIAEHDKISLTFLACPQRERLSHFFRDVWHHREKVLFDTDMPAELRETIASALLACGLQLEGLYSLQAE